MEGAHSAIAVANDFLRRAREAHRALSATQVHELVYCAQGWHLVTHNQPMISGSVAAHRGGVFVPELREARCWAIEPVRGLLPDPQDETLFPRVAAGTPHQQTIDHVWQDYGPLSRYELTRFTLSPGGPWDQVWNTDVRYASCVIPDRLMRQWFGELAKWRAAAERVSSSVDDLHFDQRAAA